MSAADGDRELMREALLRIEELQARLRDVEREATDPIAIVGLSCRFPGARDPGAFWRLLERGGDAVAEIPADRWDVDAYYDPDPDAPGKIYTRFGGFLEGIESFDPAFFGISPREALSVDPQQRLLLETAWEALERAGIAPDSLAGTPGGVFVGIGGVDYYQRLAAREPAAIDAYMASGNAHSTASGRLSYLLGLQGPSFSVDTACSSSLVALHLACRSLRARECPIALAAGVNVILSPAIHINHCRSRMLAPDGRCKAFDAAADGFIRSEGCGVVVLKRRADAIRDGDAILAVVRGSAINQDGRTSALTVPNGPAQQAVIRAALKDAAVDPAEISYVEAHGTGTALGDPIEAGALGAVFAGRAAPLPIGSVKANIGHAEAAAGIAGVIKVVLAMQHRLLPPQQHFHTPNPRIEWATLPIKVVTTPLPWGTAAAPVLAGISGFGFGGTNAHVVLEGAAHAAAASPPGGRGLLVVSARSAAALRAIAAAYAPVVGAADAAQLPAICATAATGRAHFEYRAAVIADEPTAAAAALAGVATGTSSPGTWQTRVPSDGRIVLMYPGQGSAYTGMLRGLWLRDPVFREAFDLCASALAPGLDVPLAEVMFGADADRLLAQTAYAQPAIWAAQTALTRWFAHVGVAPAAVVGHSVGEVAAWTAAGMLSVDDAARFVAARGRAMQSQPSGVMLAVMGPVAAVTALAARHEGATVASVNGPSQVVVAGPAATIAAVERAAGRDGWGTRRVRGDRAFHSSLMDDALPAIASAARSLRVHPATCAVASTLTGRLADASLTTADYWTRQARQPVQFAAAISTLWASGCRVFVEVGPSATLSALAQTCVDEPDTGSWIAGLRRDADEEATVRGSVAQIYAAGGSIDWRAWDRARRARVVLPTYPFERRRFWVDGSPAAQSERTLTYRVVWTPVEPAADAMRPGTWVVVEPANLLADALRPSGADVRSVAVTADADATVAAAAATPHGLAGVVYAGALDQPNEASVARLPEIIADACLAVVPWVKALDRLRIESPGTAARLWIVTRGAVAVTSDDRHIRLTQSPFWGFGKVVGLEHPDVWGGLLDLDPAGDAAAGLRPWLAAGPIVQHEDQIAVRHGRLWTPRLEAASSPHERVALREGATYLITGGMGGLGLRVAEWMVDRGAKQIVLVGRRAAAGAATIRIDALRDRGASIDVMQADVADATAVAQVIDRIDREMPPLRGIVHAAGVNGTSAVDALDRASFETVLSAKTAGAWVLHEAIRSRPLDFFVLFSSIASVWGSKDQAHYAAANAFLDQLAELRTRSGLAALSIAWGPWSGGGMATAAARDWLDRVGVRTMAADTGLDVLVRLLSTSGQRVAADVDWDRFLEIYTARRVRPFFDRVRPSPPSGLTVPASLPAETRLAAEIIARGPIAGRRDLLRFVTGEVTAVLNLEASNPPAPHQGFFSIGFDSLMALELKNRISRALAVVVPATLAFDYPNIHDLSEYLARDVLHLDAAALADRASSIAVAAAPDRPGTTELDATVAQALRRLERVLGTN